MERQHYRNKSKRCFSLIFCEDFLLTIDPCVCII